MTVVFLGVVNGDLVFLGVVQAKSIKNFNRAGICYDIRTLCYHW